MNPVLRAVPDVATERAFLGTALHAPVRGQLEVLRGALIVVGSDGGISAIHRGESPDTGRLVEGFAGKERLVTLGEDQCLLPGLVDLHVHPPQWSQLGLALDLAPEGSLPALTFPPEALF